MPAETPNDSPMARLTGKGVFPHQYARSLLNPLRGLILSNRALIRRMALSPGMTVLELGPGPGYFSLPVARTIAPGRLHLLDIQPEMLNLAVNRLREAGCDNFDVEVGDAAALPYITGSVDVVFMVTVLGEVIDHEGCISEAFRVLKPGGLLSVSEARGDPDYIRERDLFPLTRAAGFSAETIFRGLLHYTLNSRKPA